MAGGVAIIQGHPDPAGGHLCHALADAYAAGAAAAGHAVARIEVARLDFPILRTREEFMGGAPPESLDAALHAILDARHLVVVFPLWLGTMPALLKGFFEQVMRPGVAFRARDEGFPYGLLRGRSARLVVTIGMPALLYRWYFRAHGVRGLERSILGFAGVRPVRETLLGSVEAVSGAKRKGWLTLMEQYGRRLI